MSPARINLPVALVLVALGCAGCAMGGRQSRIEQHAAKFAALPRDVQRHVRSGNVDIGFESESVYMAIGKPSRVTRSPDAEGSETWAYRNFVYGVAPAAALTMTAPGGFADPSRVAGPGAGRGSSVPSRAANTTPSATIDTSPSGIGTLYLDFVEGRVVRIRIDPF